MESKTLIILTKSSKYHGNCVTGIDIENGKWIRLMTHDEQSHGTVSDVLLNYADGTPLEVLDTIVAPIEEWCGDDLHPENYYIEESFYFDKIRKASFGEVLKLHPDEKRDFIYNNSLPFVDLDYINYVHYSLCLVKVSDLTLYEQTNSLGKKKWKASFNYNNNSYKGRGHIFLNSQLENVSIIDAKNAHKKIIDQFEVICIDETQRLYEITIDNILTSFNDGIIEGCIFSYDFAQCLSKSKLRRNNPKRLTQIEGFEEEKLSERIRTNKEIFSYIRTMMRLTDVSRKYLKYDCIEVLYANTNQEADILLDIYCGMGYEFITFTPSQFVMNEIDHYAGNVNSHQVIGQEFDNVVIIIDKNFRYSESGDLEARDHPNPDYLFPKLFYQNITRAREKLCIIVLDNMEIFHTLLRIKDYSL